MILEDLGIGGILVGPTGLTRETPIEGIRIEVPIEETPTEAIAIADDETSFIFCIRVSNEIRNHLKEG